MSTQPDSPITQFIERLKGLDPGDRARLKRNAGNSLEEARQATGLFFRLLPPTVNRYHEPWYFLVATLYPLAEPGQTGNLGHALHLARQKRTQGGAGFDRRFEVLLDADDDQVSFRLRQIVRLLHSAEIPIDWPQLLQDLIRWNHPKRFVQESWARSYYAVDPQTPSTPSQS